eukprot:4893570-Karenia_brevis.AAC.1
MGGWQPQPEECKGVSATTSAARLELLSTRGLYAMKVRVPARPSCDTFRWTLEPSVQAHGDKWFIDGSLFDEAKRYARRTGFGIVVLDASGSLIGLACGVPPAWIKDAAGAELWA